MTIPFQYAKLDKTKAFFTICSIIHFFEYLRREPPDSLIRNFDAFIPMMNIQAGRFLMCEAPCGISAVLFLFLGTDTGISGNLCRNISGSCAGHGKGTDGSAAFLSAIVRKRKGALMQEKDVIAKEYLQDPGRFADLLNAEWFQGKQVLGPEHIREKKGRSARIHRKAGRIRTAETTEDVAKEVVLSGRTIWVMVEAQSDTHFAMPVRVANEESMRYQEQWRNIRNRHRGRKDLKGTEYLSGFGKADRLIPVVTLVLHLGNEPWKGARSLKELMDLTGWPRRTCEMIEEQKIHLIDVRRYPHPEVFRTDLCCVFGLPSGSFFTFTGRCIRFHQCDGRGSGTAAVK